MWGQGCRKERGRRLIRWVLSHPFHITSRVAAAASTADSWACKRAPDGAMVQWGWTVADLRLQPIITWHDSSIGIGVDHCAVHCRVQLRLGQQRELQRTRRHFRNWQPHLDDNCCATRYKVMFRKLLAQQSNINFESRTRVCILLHRSFTYTPGFAIALLGLCRSRHPQRIELVHLSFTPCGAISWIFDLRMTSYCFATLDTKPIGCLTIWSAVVVMLACCSAWTKQRFSRQMHNHYCNYLHQVSWSLIFCPV